MEEQPIIAISHNPIYARFTIEISHVEGLLCPSTCILKDIVCIGFANIGKLNTTFRMFGKYHIRESAIVLIWSTARRYIQKNSTSANVMSCFQKVKNYY